AVPSRARLSIIGVGDQASVDDVGQAALEAAQGLEGCLPGGEFASVVGAAFGVVAQLDDRGDVDDVVHPSVAGAREPVADLFTGGGVQGGGPGPGGEPVAVGEPGDVTDVGQDPGGAGRSDAVDVQQRRAALA